MKARFPWFPKTEDSAKIKHYTQFTDPLCKMAIDNKRVASKPKKSENEKYELRSFLLRLGFIGDEYKALRKFMLGNLTGNAAFKRGKKREVI